jgi:hypothetical protein
MVILLAIPEVIFTVNVEAEAEILTLELLPIAL